MILEDVVFKESKFEEDHVIVKQEDESDDSDDDDGFLARMTGFGAKHREKRDDKENAHSVYHISFCKAQSEAGQLAVEFNAATKRWARLPRVTFVTPSVYKFAARVGVQGALETTRVLGEPRLRGEYKKFTNNAGKSADFPGSDMDCGPSSSPSSGRSRSRACRVSARSARRTRRRRATTSPSTSRPVRCRGADLASHFSYEFSSGARMVCDLQGCFDRERGFELTDPCMLSKVGREESGYGRTDRGLHGLVDFFRTHKCTPLCKALGLTDARVREQDLVVEEALRKKEEREAAARPRSARPRPRNEKRKQEKEPKRAAAPRSSRRRRSRTTSRPRPPRCRPRWRGSSGRTASTPPRAPAAPRRRRRRVAVLAPKANSSSPGHRGGRGRRRSESPARVQNSCRDPTEGRREAVRRGHAPG